MDRTKNKAKPARERIYVVKAKNPKTSKALFGIAFGVFVILVIIISLFLG